jgi:hypothetical protein
LSDSATLTEPVRPAGQGEFDGGWTLTTYSSNKGEIVEASFSVIFRDKPGNLVEFDNKNQNAQL